MLIEDAMYARHARAAAAHRSSSDGGLDRRNFLRRSGLAAGALAVLAPYRSPVCARPKRALEPP